MTIKIKDHYFNYDNVDMVDFEIRTNRVRGEEQIYIIVVVCHGEPMSYENHYFADDQTRIYVTEEEWKQAKEKLELGIINDYKFIELC